MPQRVLRSEGGSGGYLREDVTVGWFWMVWREMEICFLERCFAADTGLGFLHAV